MPRQYIRRDFDGTEEFVTYYKDKKMTKVHREDGPAYTCYRSLGDLSSRSSGDVIRTSQWFIDNQLHREDGPAFILEQEDREVQEYYYLKGIRYTRGGWLDELKRRKFPRAGEKITVDGVVYELAMPKEH